MNFAVLQFPASNCDQDAVHVLRNVLGHSARLLWHKERSLGDVDAVIIPGGFSFGDYLRTGAIARFSPVMEAVQTFAANGGLVLGICNGFQILCEAGLLPGASFAIAPFSSVVSIFFSKRLPPIHHLPIGSRPTSFCVCRSLMARAAILRMNRRSRACASRT